MNQVEEMIKYNKACELVEKAGVDKDDIGEWIDAMYLAIEDINNGKA